MNNTVIYLAKGKTFSLNLFIFSFNKNQRINSAMYQKQFFLPKGSFIVCEREMSDSLRKNEQFAHSLVFSHEQPERFIHSL